MIIFIHDNKQVVHRPQKMDLQWGNNRGRNRKFIYFTISEQQLTFNVQVFYSHDTFEQREPPGERGLFRTWKSLSVVIGKYIRPRSLLTCASTPIFSWTSSAAVCSNPVGTVAPMVTVMVSEAVDSISAVGGSAASPSPCNDMWVLDAELRLDPRHD